MLISKLFTRGLAIAEKGSASAATLAILGSIVKVRSNHTRREHQKTASSPVERLAAESLVIQPSPPARRLAEIGAERQSYAA
ncbi:MAG TPA: hypothetical protein VEK55_02320 [Xanthobacteraceae bacterium]|nr:hypothetical protein [Xanthobacteraceae bacterium]